MESGEGKTRDKMNLFQLGDFTLASGTKSRWKIDCDALTPSDWDALAEMAVERVPPYSVVIPVPRGGFPFANALAAHMRDRDAEHKVLLVEDVVTTGKTITRYRDALATAFPESEYIGVCVFARGPVPDWVVPLFQVTPAREAGR